MKKIAILLGVVFGVAVMPMVHSLPPGGYYPPTDNPSYYPPNSLDSFPPGYYPPNSLDSFPPGYFPPTNFFPPI